MGGIFSTDDAFASARFLIQRNTAGGGLGVFLDFGFALRRFAPPGVGPAVLDDFGQPGTLVRKVMDDGQRNRLVSNVVGHLKKGVSAPVLKRAFEYWRKIDREIGDRIAKGVSGG